MSIKITVTTRVNTAKLEMLLRQLKPRADQILDKSAFDIEMTAKALAPVDTGALRASIYVAGPGRMGGGAGFGKAVQSARTAGHNRGIHSGRSNTKFGVAAAPPVEELQRAIAPAVDYAVFVEDRVKPFMMPAANAHRNSFIQAWYAFV